MNCEYFESKLADYLKGELSPSLSHEMEEHFSSCVECNKIYKAEKIISGCMREMVSEIPPENLEDRVMKSILFGEDNFDEEIIYKADYLIDCGEVETYASSYIDGSLSFEKLKPMQTHLTTCAGCRKMVEAHQLVYSSLEKTVSVKAPIGFEESVLNFIRKESHADVKAKFGVEYALRYRTAAAFAAILSFSSAVFVTTMLMFNYLGKIIFVQTGNPNPVAGFFDLLSLAKILLLSRLELFAAEYVPEIMGMSAVDFYGTSSPVYLIVSFGIIIFTALYYLNESMASVKE